MTVIRIDRTPRRIRAQVSGKTIADSVDAKLAYASGRHPEYMIPVEDIDRTAVSSGDAQDRDDFGSYRQVHLDGGDLVIGRRYIDGPAEGLVQLGFDAMDAWFEEDEQIWFHARDPFRRVDVIESSRHVEIRVDGQVAAESDRPRLVVETALPERWYVPRADVDWSRLVSSGTTSACQYKGVADWWHVIDSAGDRLVDVVWGYERPVPDASKLAGLVGFYAEHASVETVVDGVVQSIPDFDLAWLNPSLHIENRVA